MYLLRLKTEIDYYSDYPVNVNISQWVVAKIRRIQVTSLKTVVHWIVYVLIIGELISRVKLGKTFHIRRYDRKGYTSILT